MERRTAFVLALSSCILLCAGLVPCPDGRAAIRACSRSNQWRPDKDCQPDSIFYCYTPSWSSSQNGVCCTREKCPTSVPTSCNPPPSFQCTGSKDCTVGQVCCSDTCGRICKVPPL